MNLKKFAIRGIVILAICVALCMFFSGTVRTITTPKVRLTTAKRGKLEERVELACKPAFPEVDEVGFPLTDDTTLTIVKVNTREGYTVKAGDVLVEAKVANYEQLRKSAREAYDSASEALMTLENKNRGIRVNKRDLAYADAFFALRDARRAAVALELTMDAQLSREGLERADEGYPNGASDALKQLIDDWREAVRTQKAAQDAMDDAARYTVPDDVWTYITDQREQQEKKDEAEAELRRLMALNDQAKAVAAPHNGYVATIEVKEGDVYDGTKPLLTITKADALPTLRADTSELTRTVSEGMTAALNPDSYDAIETQVVAVGTDSEGKKYADIQLTEPLIKARGSVYSMLQEETPMTLIYRAREATSLLPSSAVRGSGDERYVYVTEQNTAAFGGNTMRIHKMDVTVVAEYGGTASVKEDISYYSIAYGEDRAISDGDAVMEYLK